MPLTRAQSREVDRVASEELGISGIVLMENAARSAADLALNEILAGRVEGDDRKAIVCIVCGGGNNGGDGYALARHLHNAGCRVQLFATKPVDELEGDAATNAAIIDRMGLEVMLIEEADAVSLAAERWREADLLVDALLGTGFHGSLKEPYRAIVRAINAARNERTSVLSLDIPTGLDCDTGQPDEQGDAVYADWTITFVAEKAGFERGSASQFLGKVRVGQIGVPPDLIDRLSSDPDK